MRISRYSIEHPAVVSILLVAAVVAAAISVTGLRQQMFAKIELPQAVVLTAYPGGSPEDIESDVTSILEDQLKTLDGITGIESVSSTSLSFITLSFTLDTVLSTRMVDIREKINQVQNDLPDDISGPPMIIAYSTSALSAFTAVVESSMEPVELGRFLEDEVKPRLSRISGVGQAGLSGAVTREVAVELDVDQLTAAGLTPLDISQVVGSANASLPAGTVEIYGETLSLRTDGRLGSPEDLAALIVGGSGGAVIRLADVASFIGYRESDREIIPVTGGMQVVAISVDLLQDADATRVLAEVDAELRAIELEQSGNIRFTVINDDRDLIRLSLSSVISSALMGGLLAIAVLFLFLHNVRTTTIIAVSIPVSLMLALMVMRLSGMSLNMMTLTGLTIAIGMIVDASIVMLEHTFALFSSGMDRASAAAQAADEMGGAVLASTMTTLAVFLPLLFLGGIVGNILRDISLTLAFSLIGSLIVALAVVPFLSAHTLARNSAAMQEGRLNHMFHFVETAMDKLSAGYRSILEWALDNRIFVIITAIALLGLSVLLVGFLGFEFVPSTDMNELSISIRMPRGYSLEQNAEKLGELEALVEELVPGLEKAVYFAGQSQFMHIGGSNPSRAFGILRLVDPSSRDESIFTIINLLQKEIPARIPDIEVTVTNGGISKLIDAGVGGSGLVIEVSGTVLDEVLASARLVQTVMEQDYNISKVDSNVSEDDRSLQITLDHRLMGNLGVSPQAASITNRIVFAGVESGKLTAEGEDYPIIIDSPWARNSVRPELLARIPLRSAAGNLVPMSAFADMQTRSSVSAIQHSDGILTVTLSGQLIEPDLQGTSSRVAAVLGNADMPPGIRWKVGGSAEELAKSAMSLLLILAVSVFLVYMVMVIQFERFIQPLIVMASVPFTFIGVVASLVLFRSTLNVISILGVIALAGIVVNNAIVLIDYTNLMRKNGAPLREAVVTGASSRLRPILMTTLTTVLGIIPIAYGFGEGGELLQSLGQAIVGGMLTSTLITMILIPVLYSLIEGRKS